MERLADDAGTTRSDMVRRLSVDNSRREQRQAQTTGDHTRFQIDWEQKYTTRRAQESREACA